MAGSRTVRELHHQAMILAQRADLVRHGYPEEISEDKIVGLLTEACQLEQRAAEMIPNEPESEPTRSILYLSAASLAYQAGDISQALELVEDGLYGTPPPYIQDQLEQLRLDIDRRS